jgi:hypothetical protein
MKLLGVEAIPGGVERHVLHVGDDGKDRITFEKIVDVEPILKRNAEEMASASSSFMKGDLHKVASIPSIVLEEAARTNQIPFGELISGKSDRAKSIWNSLLNGREFQAFRTKPGRVSV